MEDELIKIWRSSSNQERIKFEKSRLMIELKSSLERHHRRWKHLELVESAMAAVIGVLLSIIMMFIIPFILIKIGLILLAILAMYLIIKHQRVKKFKPNDLEDNYLDYLKKTRKYLEVQKQYLKTYVYWGILPAYPIMLLFTIGMWGKVKVPAFTYFIVFINVATIIIGIYGYYLNKKRVKKEINPRIAKVDELIKRLEE